MESLVNSSDTPVLLFAYNRLFALKYTINALKNNYLANDTQLIIFSDGPKNSTDIELVNEVRKYLRTVNGFKSVEIHTSNVNKGLADSIISGLNLVFRKYNSAIILEDDIVTSKNFLHYMFQGLNFYASNESVLSICGFSIPIVKPEDELGDTYVTGRSSSWGWGTWKNKWKKINWQLEDNQDIESLFNSRRRMREFNKMGSDLVDMLSKQRDGKLNSWAIRFVFHQFVFNMYSIHPYVSKVQNIGFNSVLSTNTKEKVSRYNTILDIGEKCDFNFAKTLEMNPAVLRQFVKPYSLLTRLKFKILNKMINLK